MARTSYDPLAPDPLFDGTLDPDLDDDVTRIPPLPAPTLRRDGLALLCAATIRFEAARRGLSQAQIAAETGLSRAAVSDRFRGRTAWTLDQVGLLAQLFGCDPGVLVTEPRKPLGAAAPGYR